MVIAAMQATAVSTSAHRRRPKRSDTSIRDFMGVIVGSANTDLKREVCGDGVGDPQQARLGAVSIIMVS
jgi:hypothetical protein